KILTIAPDGDLQPGRDVFSAAIKCKEDEPEIVRMSREKPVILECCDWSVIPLENLIAQDARVIMPVRCLEDAQTAFGILEKGVSHILIHPQTPSDLKHMLSVLRKTEGHILLQPAEIVEIKTVGMGDRVCVDTCTLMSPGQGMLVGNSSSGLFLIHAETLVNPYVAPRPFRVNAGAVHAYTRIPGDRTGYLCDLTAGDSVLLVDSQGNTTAAVVGRLKIERRPLMQITARVGDFQFSTLVQNAETIRLTRPNGMAVSVVQLEPGDILLTAIEEAGRHFGHKITETILEK
ncbi:MAG TPA: 3-dehydroquinate synthase II, partial [Desulfatirhabdiaceae bacterium]|nr:3-dehydroquinate synthase II [Desulfatirhabdiaceae bacterium]